MVKLSAPLLVPVLAAVAAVAALAACGGVVDDSVACEPGVICHDEVPAAISGSTVGGTTMLDGYSCAAADESGPERIHRIPIARAGKLHVELDESAAEANVDVRILSSLSAGACLDGGVPDATADVEPPFAYVVFDTWAGEGGAALAGAFNASLTFPFRPSDAPPDDAPPDAPPDDAPPDDAPSDDAPSDDAPPDDVPTDAGDCPANVVCVASLPYTATGTTVGGTDAMDSYSCSASTDESGPERVYRVTLPGGDGLLTVELDATLEDGATDVDVQILAARDAQQCLARNDQRASVAVSGTEAWVVLDSYRRSDGTSGEGPFSATFTFTPSTPVDPNDPNAAGAADAAVLVAAGVPSDVALLAARAYENALAQDLTESPVFTVVDFALPSYDKRMWIVNLSTGALLVNDRVAHGSGSASSTDPAMAARFSNTPGSNQSSLGLARTAETYDGNHPYSLRLDGLEDSNSNMRDRLVVMHGATYAEDSFVDQNGYLGRSNGCLAVAQSREAGIVDIVKQGTLIFSYYPDAAWLASSPFLR